MISLIRPAYDFLVKFAKKTFGLRQKEADLAQSEADAAEASRLEEAEIRRKARIIARTEAAAGRAVGVDVAAIAQGRPLDFSQDAFLGAWFVSLNSDPKKLTEKFEKTTNLEMLNAYRATCGEVLICQEHPEQAGDFIRGQRSIEAVAEKKLKRKKQK